MANVGRSDFLEYTNDTFFIKFKINEASIQLDIVNKLNDTVFIDWKKVKYIYLNDTSRTKFENYTTGITDRLHTKTIIDPSKSLIGLLHIQENKIIIGDDHGRRKLRKKALKMNGQSLYIYFPYSIKENSYEILFKFNIKVYPNKT